MLDNHEALESRPDLLAVFPELGGLVAPSEVLLRTERSFL